MIGIGYDHLFTIHTVVMMAVLMILWARHQWRAATQGWNLSRETLCRCHHCGYIFIAKRIETSVQCPSCRELNRVPPRRKRRNIRY